MCDINCIWLFNLLVAFVLIIQQQQQHYVVASLKDHRQWHRQELQDGGKQRSPYSDITSYASTLASKYLHQHSLPKANVVKREVHNDERNTDFISYLSDFNMQDETSIPEDIFDQRHLKEIEEKVRNEGRAGGSVTTTVMDVGGGGGDGVFEGIDVIDVNLPYDDSDADGEADIILESQRSSERNFTTNDDSASKNNAFTNGFEETPAGPGIGIYMTEVKSHQDVEVKKAEDLSKKTSLGKKELSKEKKDKKKNFLKDKQKLDAPMPPTKYESSQPGFTYDFQQDQDFNTKDIFLGHDNYEDEIDDDEDSDDEDDDDDGSAEYERFKLMHEQKQKEAQEHRAREQEAEQKRHEQEEELRRQLQEREQEQMRLQEQAKQLSSMRKLNERKFNKQSLGESFKPQEKGVDASFTDSKENEREDDEEEQDTSDDAVDNTDTQDKNMNGQNNDEGKNVYDQQSQQQHHQQQKQPQRQPGQSQDAIGDIADEASEENRNSFQVSNAGRKDYPNVFIPRKSKRHNGAARLDDATNRHTRIRQQQSQQKKLSISHPYLKSTNSREDNSKIDDVYSQEEYMPHYASTKEINYPKSYYGSANGNSSKNSEGQQNDQQMSSTKDDDDGNGQKTIGPDPSINHNKEDLMPVTTTVTTTTTTIPPTSTSKRFESLFEREKALRRNSKHYGHKTHKKKYKDYQHYSSVMMMRQQGSPTTTTASPMASSITATDHSDQSTSTKPIKKANNNKQHNYEDEDNLRFHKEKYAKKLKMEKLRGTSQDGIGMTGIPPSPIFVIKPSHSDTHGQMTRVTTKPFYEGQINYYLETEDDDDALMGGRGNEARFITKGDRMDTNDWYRKLSPVLRNGVKTSSNQEERPTTGVMAKSMANNGSGAEAAAAGGYTPYHHYRSGHHHQRHHHHNQQQPHQQHQHHHSHHSRHHAYQRKMLPKKPLAVATSSTPMPPPSRKHNPASGPGGNGDPVLAMQELGHQITDLKEFERYYAKWPHLARVQSQLHDEQLREQLELQNLQQQQLGVYQDYEYDEDYFEALQGGASSSIGDPGNGDENLPPYIRKYNRRNKQLLDLLEGTLPPPTRPPQQLRWSGSKLQPGPRDSSVGSMSVRIDDDYLKEKRKRYHQRQKQIHDLFEQQRSPSTTTTLAPTSYPYINNYRDKAGVGVSGGGGGGSGGSISHKNEPEIANSLPDEDVSISMETQEQQDQQAHQPNPNEHKIWQKEIATKSTKSASTSLSSAAASSNTGNLAIPWQMEKIITPSPRSGSAVDLASTNTVAVPPTPKPAIFKLPSYPSIAGSFIQRPRSRSAQFAPSSGSEFRRVTPNLYGSNSNSNFINAGGYVAYNGHNTGGGANSGKSTSSRFNANDNQKGTTPVPQSSMASITNSSKSSNKASDSSLPSTSSSASSSSLRSLKSSSSSSSSSSPASVSNSFVYHRVVDASPRLVGAGLTGRKQRLPFVAITDRRLETSKKSLTDHQKDFEQNHYPLP
ncbi:uncharacterized protein LOC142229863 [Haematobia irritans]|uniref:uncharacterized protein LOC142229863 n=1 Tax=Haematobia irritans TaxID=7368 RepID=UPI003F505D40